jgi:hypothetical protein
MKRETNLDLEYSPSIEGVADVTVKRCKSQSLSTVGNNLRNLENTSQFPATPTNQIFPP